MKKSVIISLVFLFLCCLSGNLYTQVKKKSSLSKVPRFSLSFTGGFNYVLSRANGDGSGFNAVYSNNGGSAFTANDLGMQQGYGLMAAGKYALGKKKKFRVTGNLGYNMFYNTYDSKNNRTIWNIVNLGSGIEYNFSPKQKERLFAGIELNYSIIFGAWQSDITYPDNSVSNIYTKFKPANRIGGAVTAGMEFRLSKKMDLVVAIRGVWSNIFPKNNYESADAYNIYINDSGNKNGIELNGSKDIIFLQIVTGITIPLSYK